MRRHRDDEGNRARRRARGEREGRSDYHEREEEVGRPVTDYASQGEWDQRGMSGYGGGGSFGGMGYPMTVGGHGSYVAGHRSRDWAPYREEPDWPRRQHIGAEHDRPVQQRFDSDIHRSYGSGGGGGEVPRWSSTAEQSFRGRGPRGYRRSDQRIHEDVCDRLTEDHEIDASDIDVKVEAGEVTLEGTVDQRRLKWLAEEIASRCAGVQEVHNHLRVKRHQPAGEEVEAGAESQPRNGGGRPGQTQTAQTGLGAQNRTDR